MCSGCSGRAQAEFRHAQECSPSAQVKAAAVHVQTLKRNQREKRLSLTLLVVFSLLSLSTSIILPNLTGPYHVGTIALELLNPTIPTRDLMVSFFYPTSPHNLSSYPIAADFPSKTAAYVDQDVGVPPGVAESILTQSHLNAPISDSRRFPVLLFSPGQGDTRLLYTATVEDIASLGYVVVSVDHPNDTSFIEYPGGRVATSADVVFTNYTQPIPDVEARVSDLRCVLDSLSNQTFVSQIPGVAHPKSGWKRDGKRESCFQVDRAGVFGHSLGGAAAASTMLADRRFVAGINLDGAIVGDVTTLGLSAPFLLMSSAGHNRTNDPTWASLWANLRGYKREITVAGTRHDSYTDYVALAEYAVAVGLLNETYVEALVGSIDGTRMLTIESVYIGSFFDKWLKGSKGELLDGPSSLFPEISFDD